MGFNPASSGQQSNPDMVLVARGLPDETGKKAKLVTDAADAFLEGPGSVDKLDVKDVAKRMEKHVWGVRAAEFDADQVRHLVDGGCDFIVFESMSTEAAVLNQEEPAIVATVSSDLGEQAIRAINDLQVDAVLFSPPQRDLPLTVEKLIDIQLVLGMVEMPFLIEAPLGMGAADLEVLRNLGVAGVIVDASPPEKIVELRSAIDGLPRRKPRPGRDDAVVPRQVFEAGHDTHEPPDEDDDEYEDF